MNLMAEIKWTEYNKKKAKFKWAIHNFYDILSCHHMIITGSKRGRKKYNFLNLTPYLYCCHYTKYSNMWMRFIIFRFYGNQHYPSLHLP